jgi:hypothetical protein
MAFGTSNIQYGTGYSSDEFGTGTSSYDSEYTGLGSSIYDEYYGKAIISSEVDVGEYLYEYDPLKEQNLMADYMAGLAGFEDKSEQVRSKAISERKALSRGIKGSLYTGTMKDVDEAGIEGASRAQAGLYREQFKAQRDLGEGIGDLRAAYESDMAQSVADYNAAVGGDGLTYEENTPSGIISNYAEHYGVNDPKGSKVHAIVSGTPSGDYAIRNSGVYGDVGDDDHGDTWLDSSTGNWYKYWDGTVLGMGEGEWQSKGKWNG